jgi:transposase-like protein
MRIAHRSRPSIPPRSAFARFRFPPDVIVVAVRRYLRFGLSYRDVEELLTERGVEVDHVTVYRWVLRFTPLLGDSAKPCRHAVGDRWHVDETYVRVAGQWRYVYRAIDQFGQVIDVFVSARRDAKAARRFFDRAIGTTKIAPVEVVTDQAPVYPAVLEELLPAAGHRTEQYANNRVEADHGRLKARLRPMRGLKQDRSARVIIAGTPSSRTFAADTTSWRLRSPPTGEWRSHSTNWSWRSDPSGCWPSLCPGSTQRNSAVTVPVRAPPRSDRQRYVGHNLLSPAMG